MIQSAFLCRAHALLGQSKELQLLTGLISYASCDAAQIRMTRTD